MHVAVFVSNYAPHPGGLEVMVRSLSRGLASRHQVTVVTSAWEGVTGVSEEDGLTVYRLPANHLAESLGVPYPVPVGPGIERAIRAVRSADLVHAHGALYATTVLAARHARRIKRPFVLTEHVGFVEYRRAAVNAIQRTAWSLIGDRIVGGADAVVTYNSRVQRWLQERFPGRRVGYIGNGVDTGTFRPRPTAERAALRRSFGLPAEEPLVLFAARDSEKKNLDLVVRIPRSSFRLVVCGARRELRGERVTDLGILPHERMADLFGCVDAYVHASIGEGFPLAVQEAVASGAPLVVLWDPGYDEWLSRDIVAACDTAEELGPAVTRVIGDPQARAAMTARERAWAESRWSWGRTVACYEEVFGEYLRQRTTAND